MNNLQTVLYAEDDENDVILMERAFQKLGISNPLQIVPDGKLLVAYLSGAEPYVDRVKYPLPIILLLDLSLPRKHGLEVLQWLRNEPAFAVLPVIVLTSSNQEKDIHRAYLLAANGFLIKPGDPDDLISMVGAIQQYWLGETRPVGAFVDFAAAGNVRPPKLNHS